MISLGISLVIVIVLFIVYALIMLFTGYVVFASYVNALLMNATWLAIHEFAPEWNVWYPQILDSKGWNFALISLICMVLVFIISRFPKIRMSYFISSGTIVNVILALIIMGFSEAAPSWGYAAIVLAATIVSVFIQWSTAQSKGIDDAGSFVSRIFASILLLPTPFIIAVVMFYAINEMRWLSRLQLILSVIIAGVVSLLYFLLDWFSDHRQKVADDIYMQNVEESLERRKEISEAIYEDLNAIEAIMAYLSENATFTNMQPLKIERTRILYEEARAIKATYKGTAADGTLMRVREIRTEMEQICRSFSPDDEFTVPPIGGGYARREYERTGGGNDAGVGETAGPGAPEGSAGSTGDAAAFFAGCTTEEEIKRRYRDLCKVYHPDSGNGDSETFVKITEEYERRLRT